MTDLAQAKRCEELKREAAWNPAARWRAIQEAITWAEAQAGVCRNTPARCRQIEDRKLRRGGGPGSVG